MINDLTERIIGAAITVHRYLGPGLLESSYKSCLTEELRYRGLRVQRELPVRIRYRELVLPCALRIDLLVEDTVVVEVKVVEKIAPVHVSQVLTYLRFGGHRIGLLFNFNVRTLTAGGLRRIVRGPVPSISSVPSVSIRPSPPSREGRPSPPSREGRPSPPSREGRPSPPSREG